MAGDDHGGSGERSFLLWNSANAKRIAAEIERARTGGFTENAIIEAVQDPSDSSSSA